MNTTHAMWLVHTVLVPLQVTTKAGTNPTIYALVQSPAHKTVTLVNDPVSETPIDPDAYDDAAIEYAMRAAAEAIRGCAMDPGVTNIPRSQVSWSLPDAGPSPGA